MGSEHVASQLKTYVESPEVIEKAKGREIRAHVVIVVGSRHILLWDMDKDGKLAKPRLVKVPQPIPLDEQRRTLGPRPDIM